MLLKIPKSVVISGKRWKVVVDPKNGGGWFDGAKNIISIGTKYPQDISDIFIHEVLECILTENNLRYSLGRTPKENGDLIFSFNHKEFEAVCANLAFTLFEDNSVSSEKVRNLDTNKKSHKPFYALPNKRIVKKLNPTKKHH